MAEGPLGPIDWGAHDGDLVERALAVMLLQDRPHAWRFAIGLASQHPWSPHTVLSQINNLFENVGRHRRTPRRSDHDAA